MLQMNQKFHAHKDEITGSLPMSDSINNIRAMLIIGENLKSSLKKVK